MAAPALTTVQDVSDLDRLIDELPNMETDQKLKDLIPEIEQVRLGSSRKRVEEEQADVRAALQRPLKVALIGMPGHGKSETLKSLFYWLGRNLPFHISKDSTTVTTLPLLIEPVADCDISSQVQLEAVYMTADECSEYDAATTAAESRAPTVLFPLSDQPNADLGTILARHNQDQTNHHLKMLHLKVQRSQLRDGHQHAYYDLPGFKDMTDLIRFRTTLALRDVECIVVVSHTRAKSDALVCFHEDMVQQMFLRPRHLLPLVVAYDNPWTGSSSDEQDSKRPRLDQAAIDAASVAECLESVVRKVDVHLAVQEAFYTAMQTSDIVVGDNATFINEHMLHSLTTAVDGVPSLHAQIAHAHQQRVAMHLQCKMLPVVDNYLSTMHVALKSFDVWAKARTPSKYKLHENGIKAIEANLDGTDLSLKEQFVKLAVDNARPLVRELRTLTPAEAVKRLMPFIEKQLAKVAQYVLLRKAILQLFSLYHLLSPSPFRFQPGAVMFNQRDLKELWQQLKTMFMPKARQLYEELSNSQLDVTLQLPESTALVNMINMYSELYVYNLILERGKKFADGHMSKETMRKMRKSLLDALHKHASEKTSINVTTIEYLMRTCVLPEARTNTTLANVFKADLYNKALPTPSKNSLRSTAAKQGVRFQKPVDDYVAQVASKRAIIINSIQVRTVIGRDQMLPPEAMARIRLESPPKLFNLSSDAQIEEQCKELEARQVSAAKIDAKKKRMLAAQVKFRERAEKPPSDELQNNVLKFVEWDEKLDVADEPEHYRHTYVAHLASPTPHGLERPVLAMQMEEDELATHLLRVTSYDHQTIMDRLQQVLSSVDHQSPVGSIYPIFIPSKGRYASPTALSPSDEIDEAKDDPDESAPADADSKELVDTCANVLLQPGHTIIDPDRLNGRTLVFLCVEEHELASYSSAFPAAQYPDLVLVSIPGANRGVGFARTMVLICQQLLRHLLRQQQFVPAFDYYFMTDDDLAAVRVCDRQAVKSYHRSPPSYMFAYLQHCLVTAVQAADNRMLLLQTSSADSDEESWIEQWANDVENARVAARQAVKKVKFLKLLSQPTEAEARGWVEWHNSGHLVAELLKHYIGPDTNLHPHFQQLFANLDDELTKVRQLSGLQISQMATTTNAERETRREKYRDYNQLTPAATYRVSEDRFACVINYAPSIQGFNYVAPGVKPGGQASPVCIFLPQPEIDRLAADKAVLKQQENNFLSEDSNFIDLLSKSGRYGFSMYLFRVDWGMQETGGCFPFRKVAGMQYGLAAAADTVSELEQ